MELVTVANRERYRRAVEDGILHLTPGKVVDYNEIENHIKETVSKHNLKVIGYDKWNAAQLVNNIEDAGLPTIDIGQGMSALSAASKETERMIVEKLLRHDGNPFIDWQVECCSMYTDKNDNIKITKDEADKSLKIDAVVALIMAVSMAAGQLDDPEEFNFSFIEF